MLHRPVDYDGPAARALRGLWKELPGHAGMVLGTDVSCKPPEYDESFDAPSQGYTARLESEDGRYKAWVVFDLPAAIAAAGLLVMRQETTIKQRLESSTFEGDDFDAMGEFVNQLVSPINDAIKQAPGESPHFIFRDGTIDRGGFPPSQQVICAHSPISIGGLTQGRIFLVVSPDVLGIEHATEDEGGGGLELSAEELAAIREATRASVGGGRTLVVVPIERERVVWTELLEGVGLDYEFVLDLAAIGRHLATGEFGSVIIDADTCPAGGLPVLAALRGSEGPLLPALVVASSPTRSHLLSCVAAGARAYLSKPVEGQSLVESVSAMVMIG